MPLGGEAGVLLAACLPSCSDGFGGSVAYCLLRAQAYRGRGREAGLRASVCDNVAASRRRREERAMLCGRRRMVAAIPNRRTSEEVMVVAVVVRYRVGVTMRMANGAKRESVRDGDEKVVRSRSEAMHDEIFSRAASDISALSAVSAPASVLHHLKPGIFDTFL